MELSELPLKQNAPNVLGSDKEQVNNNTTTRNVLFNI
jgi:hypothetical protein